MTSHSLTISNPINYPPREATLIFGRSRSVLFKKALRIAKRNSNFKEDNENYIVSFKWKSEEDMKELFKLLEIIGKWKNVRILLGNREVDIKAFDTVMRCFNERSRSTLPFEYCKRDSRLYCHRMYFWRIEDQEWDMTYGRFDKNYVWHFDKDKIKKELVLELDKLKFCPAIDINKIREIFEGIPKTVNPKDDPDWDYIYEGSGGLIISISSLFGKKEKEAQEPIGVVKLKKGESKNEHYKLPDKQLTK